VKNENVHGAGLFGQIIIIIAETMLLSSKLISLISGLTIYTTKFGIAFYMKSQALQVKMEDLNMAIYRTIDGRFDNNRKDNKSNGQ